MLEMFIYKYEQDLSLKGINSIEKQLTRVNTTQLMPLRDTSSYPSDIYKMGTVRRGTLASNFTKSNNPP